MRRSSSKSNVTTHEIDPGTTPIYKANELMKSMTNFEDPWETGIGRSAALDILEPPLNPLFLSRLTEFSDTMQQCKRAMSVMIHSFGYDLVRHPEYATDEEQETPEAVEEYKRLRRLFDHCNPRQSITGLAQLLRYDLDDGNAFIEVVEDTKGEIAALYHLPAAYMRLTVADKDAYKYKTQIPMIDGTFEDFYWSERFRCYVELLPNSNKKVYFKDINDDRYRSKLTGQIVSGTENLATSVIHLKHHCSWSPYGMPWYAGNIISLLGSYKAESVNYNFFDHNGIPRMAILVTNGSLTGDGVKIIEEMWRNDIKGQHHKIPIIEAAPMDMPGSDVPGEKIPPVKIDFKLLNSAVQKDAHFRDYRKDNNDGLRSAFRLPPIFIGRSDDYNRASAREAIRVAESTLFRPERNNWDSTINRLILNKMQVKHWRFKTIAPNTEDMIEVLKAISGIKDGLSYSRINNMTSEALGEPKEEFDLPPELKGLDKMPMGLISWYQQQAPGTVPEPAAKFIDKLIDYKEQIEKRINEKQCV
ncbi:MAG: phage portal protein [Nanoarchaeota archaeon]|nr:phage portal protein [Nanoarchaeota archaeon]